MGLTIQQGRGGRETLSANRTYYVRPDGSNSNDGLSNTSGGAFLTIQKAADTAASIDFHGFTVTVQIADGTYTEQVTLRRCVGQAGAANLVIAGNASTPANVVVTQAVSFGSTFDVPIGTAVTIKDLKVAATNNGYGFHNGGGDLRWLNVDFGTCGSYHVFAEAGVSSASGNYAISGDAVSHWYSSSGGHIKVQSRTITASGTRAFTIFVQAVDGSITSNGCTFSGTYTGTRYIPSLNGVIQTYGGGASYFPGNAAGSTATGGQYA